jgi:phenolic acid decarboxylase
MTSVIALTLLSCNNKTENINTKKEIKKSAEITSENPFFGKTIVHTWTKGAFAGGTYQNSYRSDSTATLRGIAGAEKGMIMEQKNIAYNSLGNGLWLVSFLEETGYTVCFVFDFPNKKIIGSVGKPDNEFYNLIGTIESVK